MELKSLLLALAFSLGIFAVKSGAGLSYHIQQETGPKRWAEEDVKNMELAAEIIMGDDKKKLDKTG